MRLSCADCRIHCKTCCFVICWELLLWFKNIIFLQGCFNYERKTADEICHRQYMISDTFELYYYSTNDVPGVKEHTHTHYEFYLFLEGAISLEIDGVLYTPTPSDLLLIPSSSTRSSTARSA